MIYIESRRHLVRPLSISRIVAQKTQVEREREREKKINEGSRAFYLLFDEHDSSNRNSSIFSWSRVEIDPGGGWRGLHRRERNA